MTQARIDIGYFNPTFNGKWDNTVTYQALNTVRYNNCVYMAKKDNKGSYPDYMTSSSSSYTVGGTWCGNVMWLHPKRADMTNNIVNLCTVVPLQGHLYYCSWYCADVSNFYYLNYQTAFTKVFKNLTKGY